MSSTNASADFANSIGMSKINESMSIFTKGLETGLKKSLNPLNDLTKNLSSGKTLKSVSTFGSVLKGMAGASVQAWALEQLMKLIEPFMKLLSLLEIPINVLAALLNMFVNEIFIQLLPYFVDFSLLLLQLAPAFKFLGEIIGWLLSAGIDLLIIGFQKLIEWVMKLPPIFVEVWDKVKKWFQEFGTNIKTGWNNIFGKEGVIATALSSFGTKIKDIWSSIFGKEGFFATLLSAAWGILKSAWENSGGKLFGPEGYIALAFKAVGDFIKKILNNLFGAINSVIILLNKIPGVDISEIPKLASGGIVSGPQLALLGDNPGGIERVQPLDKSGGFGKETQMLTEQEETNRLLRILVSAERERTRWQI